MSTYHMTVSSSQPRSWDKEGRFRSIRIVLCSDWVPGTPVVPFLRKLPALWTLDSFLLSSPYFSGPISSAPSYLRVLTDLNVPDWDPIAFQFFVESRWVRKSIVCWLDHSNLSCLVSWLRFISFTVSRVHLRTTQLTWGWKLKFRTPNTKFLSWASVLS